MHAQHERSGVLSYQEMQMSDFYQNNYKEYHEKTFSIDPSSFLEPFASRVAEGSLILDVGCGSGRDLLWLKNRGFKVIGFECSKGLAELARGNAGCEVIEGDFETFDFSTLSFDAIILVGALVHLPYEELKTVLDHITCGLGKYGKVLVNLKQGEGQSTDEHGRVFYLWQDSEMRDIFTDLGFKILHFSRQVSAIRPDDIWLGYVLEKRNGKG